MTRAEIIEKAKNYLPSFDECISQMVIIDVLEPLTIDVESTYFKPPLQDRQQTERAHVEFCRCLVNEKNIITTYLNEAPTGYKLAWVPAEYLNITFPPTDLKSIQAAEALKEYLLK